MHKVKNGEYFIKTADEMDRFLVSLGFLTGESTVKAWMAAQKGK
jgi:hypothetical protein